MAKYIYETPTSSLQWIQKNYQNVYKGFMRRLRSYGLLFHDICWPVYFKFASRGCHEKPILPKIMRKKSFNTIN